MVSRQRETDVLVVLGNAADQRVSIHIENKLASGSVTPNQPEICAARAPCRTANHLTAARHLLANGLKDATHRDPFVRGIASWLPVEPGHTQLAAHVV